MQVVELDLALLSSLVSIDSGSNGSLAMVGLFLSNLPAGPTHQYPLSLLTALGWFAGFERWVAPSLPARVARTTLGDRWEAHLQLLGCGYVVV